MTSSWFLFNLTTTLSYECNQILEAIIIVVIIVGRFKAKHITYFRNPNNSMLSAKLSGVNEKLRTLRKKLWRYYATLLRGSRASRGFLLNVRIVFVSCRIVFANCRVVFVN